MLLLAVVMAWGAESEAQVAVLLCCRKWRLLDCNWCCRWGELDLVLAKPQRLLMVEVNAGGAGALIMAGYWPADPAIAAGWPGRCAVGLRPIRATPSTALRPTWRWWMGRAR